MLNAPVLENHVRVQITKGGAGHGIDRVLIGRQSGGAESEALEVNLKCIGDEVAILFARFAVEQYCGLHGILHELSARGTKGEPGSREALPSEIVVKVLMDARVSKEISPSAIKDTSLMLLQEMQTPKEKSGAQVKLTSAMITSCLLFVERSMRQWEALASGQTLVLDLDA